MLNSIKNYEQMIAQEIGKIKKKDLGMSVSNETREDELRKN